MTHVVDIYSIDYHATCVGVGVIHCKSYVRGVHTCMHIQLVHFYNLGGGGGGYNSKNIARLAYCSSAKGLQ